MKKRILKKVWMLVLAFCLAAGMIPAGSPAVSVQAAAAKNGWVKEKTGTCYYKNGKKLTSTWLTIGTKKYYLGVKGARKENCWYTIADGKKYYSYKFNKNGVYTGQKKQIDATLVKTMDKLIKNKKIYSTTKADTALKRLFDLMSSGSYGYARAPAGFQPEKAAKDWEYGYAKEMLSNKAGSCYHFAAAFAFLAKRATGLPVRICYGQAKTFASNKWQAHCWVQVKMNEKWYTYDPNAQRFSTYRKGKWYKLAYATSKKLYKASKTITVNI